MCKIAVTTLRVVWIEIKIDFFVDADEFVTTLRVVWIEIVLNCKATLMLTGHHLAGGVD